MAAVSGVYNLVRSAVSTTTAITIQQVLAPAGTMVEFTRCWCEQSTVTTSAQTRIQLLKKTAVATVASQTPAVLGTGMQASKCVGGSTASGITATGEGTDGAVIAEEGWNIVNGWLYLPVPEERTYAINLATCLKFPTAPASASYQSGQEWLEYAS